MPSRNFLRAVGAFLGDLFQGRDRRAIEELTKKVGAAEAARIARQAGMKSRHLPLSTKPEEKREERKRVPGEDGDLIFVNSSNVHSFTFWVDRNVLQVRFLGGDSQHRAGPGPMYEYSAIPYDVWQTFKNKARSSAGGAVWDELRIRGEIAGHRYDYRLVGSGAGGTVPRKQTGVGLNPRELKQGGKTYRSDKPGTGRFTS